MNIFFFGYIFFEYIFFSDQTQLIAIFLAPSATSNDWFFLHYIFCYFLSIQGRLCCVANLKSSFPSPVAANWKQNFRTTKMPTTFSGFLQGIRIVQYFNSAQTLQKRVPFFTIYSIRMQEPPRIASTFYRGVIEKTRHLKLNDLLEEKKEKENDISKEPSLANTRKMYREEKG